MDPVDFAEMVRHVRDAEQTLGEVSYDVAEEDKLRRRSLFTSAAMSKGQVVSQETLRSVRPGHGAEPDAMGQFIGKRAKRDIPAGTPARLEDFE